MPSLKSWIAQGTGVSVFAATMTLIVYTKHVHLTPVSPATDPIVQSAFYKRYNPRGNPGIHDLFVRKIPLFKVRQELIEDAERGGGRLVERFAGGCWGCFGSLIQRKYMQAKYRSDSTTKDMLWTKQELLDSPYEEGTSALNHFTVLHKTKNTILFRAGDSPNASPDSPRETDALLEVTAIPDLDKGFVTFKFRTLLFDGTAEAKKEEGGKKDLSLAAVAFVHRWYTRLLVESGAKNCMY